MPRYRTHTLATLALGAFGGIGYEAMRLIGENLGLHKLPDISWFVLPAVSGFIVFLLPNSLLALLATGLRLRRGIASAALLAFAGALSYLVFVLLNENTVLHYLFHQNGTRYGMLTGLFSGCLCALFLPKKESPPCPTPPTKP